MASTKDFYERLTQTFANIFGEPASDIPTCPAEDKNSENPLDDSFVRLGDTYIHLRNFASAFNCYRDAIRINPNNNVAFNRLLLIPSHLTSGESRGHSPIPNALDEKALALLSLNDVFRQTLIGGFVVLSRQVATLQDRSINALLQLISTLDTRYFQEHANPMRDFGLIVMDRIPYVWMINHCNNSPDNQPSKEFPVLVVMTRKEYRELRSLFICR